MKLHPRWVLHLLPILLLEVKILHSFASLADLGEIPESLEPPACRTPELSRLLNRFFFISGHFDFSHFVPLRPTASCVSISWNLAWSTPYFISWCLLTDLNTKRACFFLPPPDFRWWRSRDGRFRPYIRRSASFFFPSLCHPDTPRHPGHFYSPIVA